VTQDIAHEIHPEAVENGYRHGSSPITVLGAGASEMFGQKQRRQPEFVVVSRREFLSDDHILVRVDRVLDLHWLREDVSAL